MFVVFRQKILMYEENCWEAEQSFTKPFFSLTHWKWQEKLEKKWEVELTNVLLSDLTIRKAYKHDS